jgi:predicted SAM-dependent methyltransferase
MALEGNAKDFGLSEIFQLISIQKKSGMLSVSGDENMAIFFQDGLIVSTRDRRARARDPLKDYLLRYGFIGRDEMNNLQQIQARSGMDLTDILLQEKYFSDEELSTIFTEQMYETVQEVLSWPKSYYKFVTGSNVLVGVPTFNALKVEGLLMESMRRIDEFPEMRRIFPSGEMVVRRLPAPPGSSVRLEKNEEIVYNMLSEETSISDLVSHSRMARFNTYEALKNLLEKELLEITKDTSPVAEEVEEEVLEKKAQSGRKLAPTLAVVFTLIACFFAGEYAVPAILPPGWTAEAFSSDPRPSVSSGGGMLSADLDEFRLRRLEATVSEGLEEYFAVKGTYPFTLEVLAVRKFVTRDTISRVHQAGIVYRMGESGQDYSLALE